MSHLRYKDRKIESIAEMLSALRQQVKAKQLVWFRGHGPGWRIPQLFESWAIEHINRRRTQVVDAVNVTEAPPYWD